MKTIVGNWKMNLGVRESIALTRGVLRILQGNEVIPEIVLCPTFISLVDVNKVLSRSKVKLGAQNCGPADEGAYTGEVSAKTLKGIGCSYVILGHSERRKYFGETNDLVRDRVKMALKNKLQPIVCVGEGLEVRKQGDENAEEFVMDQIDEIFKKIRFSERQEMIIAYEPIWAIGTGETARIEDVIKMHEAIRRKILDVSGLDTERVKVLYGGSIDDNNAYSFMREKEINGVLVGGASLKLKKFQGIVDAGIEIIKMQKL